jgi:hypothetical protein
LKGETRKDLALAGGPMRRLKCLHTSHVWCQFWARDVPLAFRRGVGRQPSPRRDQRREVLHAASVQYRT